MDWGGHTLFEDRFANLSKFDENGLGEGSFCLIRKGTRFLSFAMQ